MHGPEEQGIKSEFMYSEVGIQIVLRKERSICFDNPTHHDRFRIHALHEYWNPYRLPYSGNKGERADFGDAIHTH